MVEGTFDCWKGRGRAAEEAFENANSNITDSDEDLVDDNDQYRDLYAPIIRKLCITT
jgi:hypothetical protein